MKKLPVMEHFYTLQGEGYNSGAAAYFIRLAGCTVGCHWCDVPESWHTKYPSLEINEILRLAKASCAPNLVITGGEPLLHDLNSLCYKAREAKFNLWLETSGSENLTGQWDWVVLSPKKNKLPSKKIYERANELKVIIYNNHDFIFAEQQAEQVPQNCKLFLQPEWTKSTIMSKKIIEYIKLHPRWSLSIQMHKYLDIP